MFEGNEAARRQGIMMFSQYKQNLEAQLAADERAAFDQFLTEFPDLRYEAAKKLLESECHDNGLLITVENLRSVAISLADAGQLSIKSLEAVEADRARRAKEAAQAEEAERIRLLSEIRTRLLASVAPSASSNDLVGHRAGIEREMAGRYAYMNNVELVQRLANLNTSRELRSKSTKELRQQVQRENPRAAASALPAEYTRESLLRLAKTDYAAFKALYQKYGSAAIDERMGVVKQAQPGVAIGGRI
jgi:hypothetical protein